MKQINVRVDDEIGEAFYQFCKEQEITPYELLSSIVGFYGRGQIVTKKANEKMLTQEESLVQLGHIISDMQRFAKANGEFQKAVAALFEPHGVDLSNLWPSLKKSGEKIPA